MADLVVKAARVGDSSRIAEDMCGDPFPAELALLAECGDVLRAAGKAASSFSSRASAWVRLTSVAFRD
jgi:hypothetical protein